MFSYGWSLSVDLLLIYSLQVSRCAVHSRWHAFPHARVLGHLRLRLCGGRGWQFLLIIGGVQTPQDGGHLLGVGLFLLELGVLLVCLQVLFRPVSIFLLHRDAFHVIRVHNLLDPLVVV